MIIRRTLNFSEERKNAASRTIWNRVMTVLAANGHSTVVDALKRANKNTSATVSLQPIISNAKALERVKIEIMQLQKLSQNAVTI